MNFIYYDLAFLVLFTIVVALFLYKNRKKVKVESKVFLLYRTKIGIKFIDWFSKKFSKPLSVLAYFSITFGFLAMMASFYLLYKSVEIIATMISVPKVPPLLPLVPYVPQIFNLPLPPFYFTYWLIIILIVAVTHEFAHGIFAHLYKLKIKATGFGFLGPFLAAFVEPDEKALQKSKPKKQLAILSAGTFSNFIFAIIFLLVLQLFFFAAYDKVGVTGYVYALSQINTSSIEKINNYTMSEFFNLSDKERENIFGLIELDTTNNTYFMDQELLPQLKPSAKNSLIIVYNDVPASRANLTGAIQKIGNYKINSIDDLHNAISSYNPGDTAEIQTNLKNITITFDKNPQNESKAYLGIGFLPLTGITKTISTFSSPFFSPYSYASPKYNLEFTTFIRDLLFWLILISFSVAIINMMPLGILDGGRFLYVAVLLMTKSKKRAEQVYKIISFLIILALLAMMVIWLFRL